MNLSAAELGGLFNPIRSPAASTSDGKSQLAYLASFHDFKHDQLAEDSQQELSVLTPLGIARKKTGTEEISMSGRPCVAHIVTSDLAVVLMRGQLRYLKSLGFDVSVICSPGKWLERVTQTDGVRMLEVPMAREIAPLRDIAAVWRLWRLLRTLRPSITN